MAKLQVKMVDNIEDEYGYQVTFKVGSYTVTLDVDYDRPNKPRIEFYPDDKVHPDILQDRRRNNPNGVETFKIQTTAYGALTPNEIYEVIGGYEDAIDTVNAVQNGILDTYFLFKGE